VAEQLCDKIAILKKGKLLFYGTIQELKGQQPESTLEEIYLSLAGRQEGVDSHAV
jgi:ABC superfamily ATP binding cassette transporter, ABC protein